MTIDTRQVQYCDAECWEGCEPGWYWGEVDEEGVLGDSYGPFESEWEASEDLVTTRKLEELLNQGPRT